MRRKDTMHNWYQLTHFAGFDWTKDHHDVAILDRQGQVVNRFTFAHSGEGWAQWREKIQAYQAPAGAIETSHGAAVEQLLAYSSELSKTYAILRRRPLPGAPPASRHRHSRSGNPHRSRHRVRRRDGAPATPTPYVGADRAAVAGAPRSRPGGTAALSQSRSRGTDGETPALAGPPSRANSSTRRCSARAPTSSPRSLPTNSGTAWPARTPTPGVGVGKALSSCSPEKPLKLSPKTFLLHPLPLELLLTPRGDHDVPGHPESWQESTELAVPNGRQAAHLSRQLGNGGV
jgi:hypothetical protein